MRYDVIYQVLLILASAEVFGETKSAVAFTPNDDGDPRIREALARAMRSGAEVYAVKIHPEDSGAVVLDDPDLPVLLRRFGPMGVRSILPALISEIYTLA